MDDNKELNEILREASQEKKTSGFPQPSNRSRPSYNDLSAMFEDDDDDEDKSVTDSYCQWSVSDGRIFVPTNKTQDILTPGVYEIKSSPSIGLYFEKIPIRTENLIRFPDSNSDKVIEEISNFWDREHLFKQYDLVYKRGILLWGNPGSGKSSLIQILMNDVVDRGGVVFRFTHPGLFLDGMRAFRKIQPKTPVVVIMEDIDSIIENYSESEVLNLLDGVNEVYRIVFVATTNYPGKLGGRIINRPSRFDKRIKIGMPNAESRRLYLGSLFKKMENCECDLDLWVKDTEDLSLAHIKELFIAVTILGDPYDEALETIKSMEDSVDDREYGTFGFGSGKK